MAIKAGQLKERADYQAYILKNAAGGKRLSGSPLYSL